LDGEVSCTSGIIKMIDKIDAKTFLRYYELQHENIFWYGYPMKELLQKADMLYEHFMSIAQKYEYWIDVYSYDVKEWKRDKALREELGCTCKKRKIN
jgi:hypothetical protein